MLIPGFSLEVLAILTAQERMEFHATLTDKMSAASDVVFRRFPDLQIYHNELMKRTGLLGVGGK